MSSTRAPGHPDVAKAFANEIQNIINGAKNSDDSTQEATTSTNTDLIPIPITLETDLAMKNQNNKKLIRGLFTIIENGPKSENGLTECTVVKDEKGVRTQMKIKLPPVGSGTIKKSCKKCGKNHAITEFFVEPLTTPEKLFGNSKQCLRCILSQIFKGTYRGAPFENQSTAQKEEDDSAPKS